MSHADYLVVEVVQTGDVPSSTFSLLPTHTNTPEWTLTCTTTLGVVRNWLTVRLHLNIQYVTTHCQVTITLVQPNTHTHNKCSIDQNYDLQTRMLKSRTT